MLILTFCLLQTLKKKHAFYGFLKVRSKAQTVGRTEGGPVASSGMDVAVFGYNLAQYIAGAVGCCVAIGNFCRERSRSEYPEQLPEGIATCSCQALGQAIIVLSKKIDLKSLNAFFSSCSFEVLSPKLAKYGTCTCRSYVKYRFYIWIQAWTIWLLLLSCTERATEKKSLPGKLG